MNFQSIPESGEVTQKLKKYFREIDKNWEKTRYLNLNPRERYKYLSARPIEKKKEVVTPTNVNII